MKREHLDEVIRATMQHLGHEDKINQIHVSDLELENNSSREQLIDLLEHRVNEALRITSRKLRI